ncbi:MAG TPA: MmgE/PrpD family protein, partial [Gammaproteobacteria bacterium]|nr:MmgE/PrpD family protein [Gammaproteobacteria bacterium]
SARYCVASALVRRVSRLTDFRPAAVADAQVRELIQRIECSGAVELDEREHSAVELDLLTVDGTKHSKRLDISPGFPGNALSDRDHRNRFDDCMAYSTLPLTDAQIASLRAGVNQLPELKDVRVLLDALIHESGD